MEAILKEILSKLSSLDDKVSSLDNKFSSLDDKVSGLDAKVSGLDAKVSTLDNKVSNLDDRVSNMENGQIRIEQKLDAVYEQVANLTEFEESATENFNTIKKDVSFLKHKLHQNEEEIFDIKSYIKLVK